MRKLATAVVAAGLFFGGMGVAVASSPHKLVMRTPGVAFVGTYAWQPTTKVPSGLHVKGELRDENDGDGHNVYLRVKVEEYPWGDLKGVQRADMKVDKVFTDGAVLKTKEVRMQVCLDRGSLRPDYCSRERLFSRR
ncbi:hypothetical protein ACFY8C_15030 [Streptomyces flavochromogenes]|uniref:Uncharacterized protein n=1 Tax=Streptomyces flavochromogenes TaxID=68199 RepID=A0ABW6XQ73_9ACTN|nr:hypothetical protein [Streptomyces flavochromogenes]